MKTYREFEDWRCVFAFYLGYLPSPNLWLIVDLRHDWLRRACSRSTKWVNSLCSRSIAAFRIVWASSALLSLFCRLGDADLCRNSTKHTSMMALAAPSVGQSLWTITVWSDFCFVWVFLDNIWFFTHLFVSLRSVTADCDALDANHLWSVWQSYRILSAPCLVLWWPWGGGRGALRENEKGTTRKLRRSMAFYLPNCRTTYAVWEVDFWGIKSIR